MKKFGVWGVVVGIVVACLLAAAMVLSRSGVAQADSVQIEAKTWTLIEWAESAPLPAAPVTIQIEAGRLHAQLPCNSVTAPVQIGASEFHVGAGAATLKFCDQMADETAVTQLLGSVQVWRIDAGELVLSSGDEPVLRFTA
ncbi:MAG: META domain-containing protein [Propionibacteriaceae bacterium]|jgi:heat shock protein HslJ|nr:META domain-containing protein [Propionibacteriaceae bacterium]